MRALLAPLLAAGLTAVAGAAEGSSPRVAAPARSAAVPTREPVVLIEIPAGGSVKYEWKDDEGRFVVDRFLTMPVAYPANYGFVRETLAGDGDPLDVLVYTREPVMPGALIKVRLIGILRMTDRGEADDKLIAVPATSVDPLYEPVRDVSDLSLMERRRLEAFFVIYKLLPEGRNPVELGAMEGPDAAQQALEEALLRRSLPESAGAPPR